MNDPSLEPSRIGALAEEFLDRRNRGERPTVAEYAEKYPGLAGQIRAVFPALLVVEDLKPGLRDVTGSQVGPPGLVRGRAPERLGDFRIIREVGRGGMGIVYEAEQESLGRRVALKVLGSSELLDPKRLERFHREAKAAARLHHTNIVPVFGVGESDGVHYYVMQFIAGAGLDEVLDDVKRLRARKSGPAADGSTVETGRDLTHAAARSLLGGRSFRPGPDDGSDSEAAPGPPTIPVPHDATAAAAHSGLSAATETAWCYARGVARIGVQVAEALEYAHGQAILHRDIKPSNILLDAHGTAWVADFGLAKAAADDDLTHPGDIVGTVRYMAPERFHGRCDALSDLYALGLTLYELLARRPAFDGADRNALIRQVGQEEPARLRKVEPSVPRDLDTIIHKAIDKDPAHRYPSAGALAEDLHRFLDDRPIQARRATLAERAWRWSRRNRTTAALAATAASSLLLAAIVGWVGYASTTKALEGESKRRKQAEQATERAIKATQRAEENVVVALEVFGELFDKLVGRTSFLPPLSGPLGSRPTRSSTGPARNRPVPDGRPSIGPSGAPFPGNQLDETALLLNALRFYDRFARRNERDARLQGEAARAYRKVGSIYRRMGREAEAEAADARALRMFEELAAQCPSVPRFRFGIVETILVADPWTADPSSLGRLEQQLRRAGTLIDRLAAETPEELLYIQAQVHVQAKLGATLQRLNRADESEACYRRAISLSGSLLDRRPGAPHAYRDRAGIYEALCSLQMERGRPEPARTSLDAAAADLEHLAADALTRPFGPLIPGERFEALAGVYTRLGATDRAEEMNRWAKKVEESWPPPPQGSPGRGPGPPRRLARPK